MLKKLRKMLKQQEGFTLMELMIAVLVVGILAGIAIPTYRGVQERARLAVGQANAAMLNRAVDQLMMLEELQKGATSDFYVEGVEGNEGNEPKDDQWVYCDNDGKPKDENFTELLKFVDLTAEEIEYVVWDEEEKEFVADTSASKLKVKEKTGG